MQYVVVLAVLFTGISLAACVTAVAIPYWLYNSSPNEDYQGLWQRCIVRTEGGPVCAFLAMQPEFMDAVRVMMILGIIVYVLSLLAGFVYTFIKPEKTRLGTAATVLTFIGGAFCTIGVVVYASKYTLLLAPTDRTLHAGFGLAVVSAIGGFASGLIYCLAHARGDMD